MADDIERLNNLNILLPIEKTRDSRKELLLRGNIKKREKKRKEEERVEEAFENESQGENLQNGSSPGKILDIIV